MIKIKIDDMRERIKPEIIYIAIDGVAPVGKILQQRQRRYRYLYDNNIKMKKTNNNIKIDEYPVSSIELTPGTEYMERIHKELERYSKEIEIKYKIKCIYSSYHEEGEGEHKVLTYIKERVKREEKTIIYGLDADLVMLSFLLPVDNIIIAREMDYHHSTEYVDVAAFKSELLSLMRWDTTSLIPEKQHTFRQKDAIHDFVVLSFLVGNDFLPTIPTLAIIDGFFSLVMEHLS